MALSALTMVLVASAADRSAATFAYTEGVSYEGLQQAGARGQTAPARQESQRPSQPRLPWWKDPVVVKELSLTPDQAAKIDAIWKKREQDMHGVVLEHKKQQDELDRLVAERKVGPDVIGLHVDRVEAQRTTLNKSWTVMIYQFSRVLSPEQNTALKAYFERNRRNRR